MKMMKTLHDHKRKTENLAMKQRVTEHQKKVGKIEEKKEKKQREIKRDIYKALGQIEKKKNKFKD